MSRHSTRFVFATIAAKNSRLMFMTVLLNDARTPLMLADETIRRRRVVVQGYTGPELLVLLLTVAAPGFTLYMLFSDDGFS
jgi:hypothetical protein